MFAHNQTYEFIRNTLEYLNVKSTGMKELKNI